MGAKSNESRLYVKNVLMGNDLYALSPLSHAIFSIIRHICLVLYGWLSYGRS